MPLSEGKGKLHAYGSIQSCSLEHDVILELCESARDGESCHSTANGYDPRDPICEYNNNIVNVLHCGDAR